MPENHVIGNSGPIVSQPQFLGSCMGPLVRDADLHPDNFRVADYPETDAYKHRIPFAAHRGEATTSSSGGLCNGPKRCDRLGCE
jgi:hypothetical protein